MHYKYNPSQISPQELEATFVGREYLMEEILSKLNQQAQAKSNQNYLIIGPRGIGKTNTLLILKNRIIFNKTLSRGYLPLNFAEEEYSVITLRDFFVKILEVLKQDWLQDDCLTAFNEISRENSDEKAVEKAISFLKTFSHKNSYKLLLFIDNFELIFSDQIRQQSAVKRLRDVLMNDNFMLIIGAAPTYFEEVMNYKQPLYNFFKIYSLEEFDFTLMQELLFKQASCDNNNKLVERLKTYQPKLKALYHLTGGNPRMILMLYQALAFSELPGVKTVLNSLLDDLTPYFKNKLESIRSPQQRKIVDTLALLDRAASPTELARAARLPVNQVSSLIKRLQNEGYIRLAPQKRRKTTYYILSERLFRIWHQMRYQSSHHQNMPFLIEFISIWYSLKELKTNQEQFEMAVQNSNNEMTSAHQENDIKSQKNDTANKIQSLLNRALKQLEQKNFGKAKQFFMQTLQLKSRVYDQLWHQVLVEFFSNFITKYHCEFFFELYELLKKKSLQEEAELLRPMAIVCDYWQKGEDAEVLDRLNPELRELVEDIIKTSRNKKEISNIE
ncbi:MAG: ATP-binding protein [Candidatus Aminicenantes bacterium]|jgi:hypothetical protein